MEIGDIIYLAFATLLVIILLHLGVFWVSRVIQPPKPKIVYVQQPPPVQTQPTYKEPAQTVQVPTYEPPPPATTSGSLPMGQLPPPIETRQSK
jgi:hypothetical protein